MERRAAIYCRISQDREGAGLGVQRQEADCRALAAAKGWQVVAVHTDNDLSAYTGKPRPGYAALLDQVRAGQVQAVLAWHTDRLHRSPVELEHYIDACEPQGTETHTVKAGPLDLTTAVGRMVARQHGAVARYEVEHMAERQRAARQQAAEQGRFGGGRRPYGYQRDGMTLVPSEAAEVARCSEQVLAGATLGGLAADLNRRERPTSTGGRWTATELRRVLLRPRNAALREHQGVVIGRAGWPPLVDEPTWRAVVAVLTDPARRTNPGRPPRWLLSGIARCGVCGGPMVVTSSAHRRGQPRKPAYACRVSKHVVRAVAELDAHVQAVIVARLARPDAVDLLRPRTSADDPVILNAQAEALDQKLKGLAVAYANDDIDAAQLRAGSRRLRERLADVERRLPATVTSSPLEGLAGAPDVADRWLRLGLARQRAVIQALATVVILPVARKGRRAGWKPGESYFDPASVRITPKAAT
jgi:DNA invertase Pin-like site-specific DNA recombinase